MVLLKTLFGLYIVVTVIQPMTQVFLLPIQNMIECRHRDNCERVTTKRGKCLS